MLVFAVFMLLPLAATLTTEKLSLGRASTGLLNIRELHGGKQNKFVFPHVAVLLSAIDRGIPRFHVKGHTDYIPDAVGEGGYADAAQYVPHTTTIEYELDPATTTRYFNLDSVPSPSVKTMIVEMSDHHLVHCNWETTTSDRLGTSYIVGSNHGEWVRLPHVVTPTFLTTSCDLHTNLTPYKPHLIQQKLTSYKPHFI